MVKRAYTTPPGAAFEADGHTAYIYLLRDPDTLDIRYVGKSVRPIERLYNHLNERSHCHRSYWLQKLKSEGKEPVLEIVEEIRGLWPWQEAERYWIASLRALGANLVNNTSGGDGVPNLSQESRDRMRKASTGRKHTPEALAKMAAASRGHRASEETRAKMSASQKGRKILWIDSIAAKLRKIPTDHIQIIKTRLLAGESNNVLAREYGVHRTTMSKIKMGTYLTQKRKDLFGDRPASAEGQAEAVSPITTGEAAW